jgi:hypothetical protein
MPRRRTAENRQRDARALDLHARGLTYQQISDQIGWASGATARDAVQRAIRDNYQLSYESERQVEDEAIHQLIRAFTTVMVRRHYVVTPSGRIVTDPLTGQPLIDDGPLIQAGLALLRARESRRKLLGLDKPAKVEIRTINDIDARLAELADQVEVVDTRSPQALPGPARPAGTAALPSAT